MSKEPARRSRVDNAHSREVPELDLLTVFGPPADAGACRLLLEQALAAATFELRVAALFLGPAAGLLQSTRDARAEAERAPYRSLALYGVEPIYVCTSRLEGVRYSLTVRAIAETGIAALTHQARHVLSA